MSAQEKIIPETATLESATGTGNDNSSNWTGKFVIFMANRKVKYYT